MSVQERELPFYHFLVLWITQSISVLGSNMTFFALILWLTVDKYPRPDQHNQLSLSLAVVGLAVTVPSIIFGPFAGAWADKVDRKRTMFWMNVLSASVSSTMAVLLDFHQLNLSLLILLLVVASVVGEFHMACFAPAYVHMVSKNKLGRANGMMQATNSAAMVLAPTFAALIMAVHLFVGDFGGTAQVLTVDAVTFAVAALALPLVVVPSPHAVRHEVAAKPTRRQRLDFLMAGAVYVYQRKALLWMLMTFTIGNFALQFNSVLEPMIVKSSLAADMVKHGLSFSNGYAMIMTFGGVGGIVGSVVMSIWGGLQVRRVFGVIIPAIFTGLGLAGFGYSHWYYVSVIMTVVVTVTMPITAVHSQTIWQSETPHEIQGRVFAFRFLISRAMMPVGTSLAGVLGTIAAPGVLLVVTGLVFALFNVAQMWNRTLLHVETTIPSDVQMEASAVSHR